MMREKREMRKRGREREVPSRINVIKLSKDPIMTSKRKGEMESWCGRRQIKRESE